MLHIFMFFFGSESVNRQEGKRDAELRFDLKLQFMALIFQHDFSMLAFSRKKIYKRFTIVIKWR